MSENSTPTDGTDAGGRTTGSGGNGPSDIPEETVSSESDLALSAQAARRDADEQDEE